MRTNVEVSPRAFFTTGSSCLKLSIVVVVVLFRSLSFSALLMVSVMTLPELIRSRRWFQ